MMSNKFVHIINPVKVNPSSDLHAAQPFTFESLRKAKEFAKEEIDVALITAQYPEDHEIIPDFFIRSIDLNRSVLNFGEFEHERKLPLIQDILERAYKYSKKGEYLIYTNVDISVMPFFYNYILSKIKNGSDSLIINRRVIKHGTDLTQMCADIGKSHPGFDCFVFRRELLDNFELGHACIGANWIGRVMISNLIMFSNKLEIIKDAHLTFHIGDDGAWLKKKYTEFDLHNKNEAYQIINSFIKTTKDEKKKSEFREIIQFMDNWGINELHKNVKDGKWSLKKKIKFKLRQYLS
ncbi:MAG: hypothetical protein ACOCWM_05080 [Cyclobacteriaceae bacterium]